jgi:hypothetical protein
MRKTATGASALRTRYALFALVATWSLTTICGANAESDSNLAQELTNPVASVIQVPFQNNFDWRRPHNDAFRYTLNIQPVIPLSLNSDWNLIVRTIVPFASFDGLFPQTETGLADTLQSFFLSSARPTPSGIVWGVGPVFLYPTATNAFFAGRQWGAGPTGVILRLDGPWTHGVLANHVWSLTSVPSPTAPGAPPSESETEEMIAEGPTTPGRWRINNTFLQPFLTYAFPTHTTVSLSSETQYNCTTRQWTVPIAAGVNQLVRVGGQIVQLGERSDTGSSGQPAARPGACVSRRPGCCRPDASGVGGAGVPSARPKSEREAKKKAAPNE